MKITIKRNDVLPIDVERKMKLESLGKKRKKIIKKIGFDWSLLAEDMKEDEDKIKNFHLFCISIVKDLFAERFKTNETGLLKYENPMSEKNIKFTLKNLDKMFSIINKNKEK